MTSVIPGKYGISMRFSFPGFRRCRLWKRWGIPKVYPGISEETPEAGGGMVSMKGLRTPVEWETILDAIPDAVSVIDRDSRFVYVNRAMARFIGLPPAQVVGRLCFELVHCTTERVSQFPS